MKRIGMPALCLGLILCICLASCTAAPEPGTTGGKEQTGSPTQPSSTAASDPGESTPPTQDAGAQIPDARLCICLDTMLNGSGITITREGQTIVLSEDGLRIELSEGSPLVYREGFVAAVMKCPPEIVDGKVFVETGFYDGFLCGGDGSAPSVFHGVLFFADEILLALEQPEASAFHQKLLDEVLLPRSMNIETPHIDMNRVFQSQPLSGYPGALAQELAEMGYSQPETFTYSEYILLTGARTLAQAGMASVVESYEALRDADPEKMTVAEYIQWQMDTLAQTFADGLTEEEQTFARDRQIELSDLAHLMRVFPGTYRDQSDEALKQALEAYYATDLEYLRAMANPEQ